MGINMANSTSNLDHHTNQDGSSPPAASIAPNDNLRSSSASSASSRTSANPVFSSNDGIPPHLRPFGPNGSKSLAGIAMRAFCLGMAASFSLLTMFLLLVFTDNPGWRVPFFVFALSVFHFLEFWTTAEKNTMVAGISSFLLTANWPAYAIAHSAAFIECAVVSIFFPRRNASPPMCAPLILSLGLLLVVLGQTVRSAAMLHAGASFNHEIQSKKAASHQLVVDGIYGVFRHPSYFGFFYWGLGTQLVMGNIICFMAYAWVLWYFFNDRIRREEKKLIEFFGNEYVQYRRTVGTKIPFIP